LIVVAVLGGVGIYTTHIEPGQTTEERVVATWSDHAEFSHTSVAQRDTSAFPVDTELRNQPVYYTTVSPDVAVEYVAGYDASESGQLDIKTTFEILWQSTDNNENVLWQVTEPLSTSEWSDVEPGERQQIGTTFNATEMNNRIGKIETELGSSRGSTETILRVQTTRSGTVNGESVRQTRTHTLPFDYQGTTYGFLEPSVETYSQQQTELETVPVTYGPVQSIVPIVLTMFSLIGLVALGVARFRQILELSAAEEAELEHTLVREEFDEWITPGTYPESLSEEPRVEISSLEGIVNVAIDSGRRVIEDGAWYVLRTPELTYVYVNEALDQGSIPTISEGTPDTRENTDTASNGQKATQKSTIPMDKVVDTNESKDDGTDKSDEK
jgi:hypothetical protein